MKEYLTSVGEKPFRASQIFEWLYRHKINSFDEISNMKKTFIETLKQDFIIDRLELVLKQESSDGTIKFLFRLSDGNLIETVNATNIHEKVKEIYNNFSNPYIIVLDSALGSSNMVNKIVIGSGGIHKKKRGKI